MNLNSTVTPKSSQLNSDDLIGGPRTIKITNVTAGPSKEQPIEIHFEGDNDRPYIPSKSMRRVFIVMWGSEGDVYAGRRVTLYRDPEVKFGGEVVGGIKISHASHIDKPLEIMLTATRGKRKPHNVDVLAVETITAPVLANLPPEWVSWSNEERGANRAAQGTDALKQWWGTLSKDERDTLKAKLVEWKAVAEGVK